MAYPFKSSDPKDELLPPYSHSILSNDSDTDSNASNMSDLHSQTAEDELAVDVPTEQSLQVKLFGCGPVLWRVCKRLVLACFIIPLYLNSWDLCTEGHHVKLYKVLFGSGLIIAMCIGLKERRLADAARRRRLPLRVRYFLNNYAVFWTVLDLIIATVLVTSFIARWDHYVAKLKERCNCS